MAATDTVKKRSSAKTPTDAFASIAEPIAAPPAAAPKKRASAKAKDVDPAVAPKAPEKKAVKTKKAAESSAADKPVLKIKVVKGASKEVKVVEPPVIVEAFESLAVTIVEKAKDADAKAAKSPAKPKTSRTAKAASSPAKPKPAKTAAAKPAKKPAARKKAVIEYVEPPKSKLQLIEEIVESPLFKAMYDPELPRLDRENRGRLLMQTPDRLYFYWSIRTDPYEMLSRAFGHGAHNYTLVLKMSELNRGREEMFQADSAGNWWFEVEPEGRYQAEIGFYSPSRPYIRILYSNVVETPRNSPSSRPADSAEWRVTSEKFSRVLSASGFARDAVEVAMLGDDPEASNAAAGEAFSSLLQEDVSTMPETAGEDLRYILLAIASGMTLAELRSRISAELYDFLLSRQSMLTSEGARRVLNDQYFIDEEDFDGEEMSGAVFGNSVVNFPSRPRKRRRIDLGSAGDYNPLSSVTVKR